MSQSDTPPTATPSSPSPPAKGRRWLAILAGPIVAGLSGISLLLAGLLVAAVVGGVGFVYLFPCCYELAPSAFASPGFATCQPAPDALVELIAMGFSGPGNRLLDARLIRSSEGGVNSGSLWFVAARVDSLIGVWAVNPNRSGGISAVNLAADIVSDWPRDRSDLEATFGTEIRRAEACL
jgi:hypothetical protein